ncbi:unnamed protein product [Rotaria socialis]|uniref:Fas-associated factor 1/2-like UAS domain-containing protein n=1 Tax=Rotaria socialis TaxID=392032 RepID=A0A821CDK3_9BILA|nr:unnamed protein product [Rotaria socialis]
MESNPIIEDNDVFNDDGYIIPSTPFPMEYPNDVAAIESISKCFHRRYDACPVFYMGSFTKACQAAFSPTVIEERRPVLVYVHHDGSMLDNIFCNRIFCSTTIIEYLLENYIVWPCDVTLEGNRNR